MMWKINPETSAFYREDGYIEWCFNEAKRYFPNNQLVINELSCMWEESGTNRHPYYMMIERALRNGARIDAVGMQYHMFCRQEQEMECTQKQYNPRCVYQTLDRYSDFKLPIQITEVTIPAYSNDSEDEAIRAEIETDEEGNAYFHGFYGDYEATIDGKEYTLKAVKSVPQTYDGTKSLRVEL